MGTTVRIARLSHSHRPHAVRAHLLELVGDAAAARESYLRAATMTASVPERRYLTVRATWLGPPSHRGLIDVVPEA